MNLITSPGGMEFVWIVIVVLILLMGSKRVPEVARTIGRAMTEFRKATTEIQREFNSIASPAEMALPSRPPSTSSEWEKLANAARSLGIPVEGKTEDELRESIKKAVGEVNQSTKALSDTMKSERQESKNQ